MRVVFAGTPEVALPSFTALLASDHEVVGVVTRPDAPVGRGRKLTPSPVAQAAAEAGIPVFKPERPNSEEFVAQLAALEPDVAPVVAYGALLGDELLAVPRLGWVNLHFSLLPRWRGAAPVQRAIMAGDRVTGTTCFQIVKQLDAGDVIAQAEHPIGEQTAGELLAELAETGASQLVAAIEALAAGQPLTEQPEDGVTYAAKLTVDDARMRFDVPAEQLRNQILGCSPDPGAWCEIEGQRFKIYRARLIDGDVAPQLSPGEVLATKKQVFVGTGSEALELLEVQAPGKRRMAAIDWARGIGQGVSLT